MITDQFWDIKSGKRIDVPDSCRDNWRKIVAWLLANNYRVSDALWEKADKEPAVA